jgi:phosphonoacetaldehyde hydrolase
MLRNFLSLPRQLAPSSRRFFSQIASQHPNFHWAHQRILNIPLASRVEVLQVDAAGTIVDPHCIGPFFPFEEVFSKRGFKLTEEQILGPMGMSKIKHIEHLLNEIEDAFYKKYLRKPAQTDVKEIYDAFMLLLPESVKQRTQLTPGTELAVNFILQNNMKLALTSGYPRAIADLALVVFRKLFPFYESTTSDEVSDGSRIAMLRENNKKLGTTRTIFLTDAPNDIANVLGNIRADELIWVIGISGSSVCMNITSADVEKTISEKELLQKRKIAKLELEKCEPHAVIEDMSQLPFAIAAVCTALHQGLKPANTKNITLEFPDAGYHQSSTRPRSP